MYLVHNMRPYMTYLPSRDMSACHKTLACRLLKINSKMAGRWEFLLMVSSLFVFGGATVPYKTAYLEQDLDHFNFVQANKVTFKQRYLYTGKALTIISDTDGTLEVKLHDVVHFVAEPG